MPRSIQRVTCAALLAALVFALPAHAQFGGLKDKLKKKAESALGSGNTSSGSSAAPATAPAAKDSTDLWYYGLNDRGLDRYVAALRAEVAKAKEVEQRRAARKTPEQYGQCIQEFAVSDSGMKMMQEYSSAMSDPAKAAAVGKKVQEMEVKHCGPNPSDPEIQRQEEQEIAEAGTRATHMTEGQMGLFRERIVPYLQGGGPDASTDKVFKTPGSPGMFYTYQPDELKALKSRAAVLAELFKEVP